MTWEALAGWLQGPMDAAAWQAVIPSMGYMALLRNLRNLDEAGVSDEVAAHVAARLADPGEVARSRQLPFRFYSAYRSAPSLRWGHALERALTSATGNVPSFGGRTLVLVDTSASMTSGGVSARSKVTPAQAAALFGVALAARGERVDLYGFADGVFRHGVRRGASVLKEVERFCARTGEVGHGTQIADSVRRTYSGHDRVVILSDMQTMSGHYGGGVTGAVPEHVPMYGFNLQGYRHAAMPTGSGNRHEFGGFSDAVFRLIPLLEAGRDADWPF
ncbi:TROVE domain-containing protein [Planomonospora algeriensis]